MNNNVQTRITTPILSMEVINKSTKKVVNRTDYSIASSSIRNKISFILSPSIGNYENVQSIKLRFKQPTPSTGSATVYEANDSYAEVSGGWSQPLDYIVENGIIYREVDLTGAFSEDFGTKYFTIMGGVFNLYTSDASSEYRPQLIIKVIPELDFLTNQVEVNGSVIDDLYKVNIRDGKISYNKSLIGVKTTHSMINIGMSYNVSFRYQATLTSGINTGLGKGFKFNYQQYVYKSGLDYVYLDANYLKHTFKPGTNVTGTGNKLFYDSLGTYMILEETSTGVIIYVDDIELSFNSLGLLSSIKKNISDTIIYEEIVEYYSDNKLKKVSSGNQYVEIIYLNQLITIRSNDGREVNVIVDDNNFINKVINELGKEEEYIFNSSKISNIKFKESQVVFDYYSNNKVKQITKKYNLNEIEKIKIKYIGDRTKVEKTRFSTASVEKLKTLDVFIFDERGYNIASYQEENGKVGSLIQYEYDDYNLKKDTYNSGLELYKNTLTFDNSTSEKEIVFSDLSKGKYILSYGYKINRNGSNNLADATQHLTGTILIGSQVVSTYEHVFPAEEFLFIKQVIEVDESIEPAIVKLKFSNSLANYNICISGIVLTPKPSTEAFMATTLVGNNHLVTLEGEALYNDKIMCSVIENGVTQKYDMNLDDIIRTQKSLFQSQNKVAWFNGGKGIRYNISDLTVTNNVNTQSIKGIKASNVQQNLVYDKTEIEGYENLLVAHTYNVSIIEFTATELIVKSINSSSGEYGEEFDEVITERYDKYNRILTKVQNSKNDEEENNPDNITTYNYFNSKGLLQNIVIEQNGLAIKENFGYNDYGSFNYYDDEIYGISYDKNILGNLLRTRTGGKTLHENEYHADLSTLKRVYFTVDDAYHENRYFYYDNLLIEKITNNNLSYIYSYDDCGRVSQTIIKEKIDGVEVQKSNIVYNYVVNENNYEIILICNGTVKTKHTFDKYDKLISYYEYNNDDIVRGFKNVYLKQEGCDFRITKLSYKEIDGFDYREIYKYNSLGQIEKIINEKYDYEAFIYNGSHKTEDKYIPNYVNKRIIIDSELVTIDESATINNKVNNVNVSSKIVNWKKDKRTDYDLSYDFNILHKINCDGIGRISKDIVEFNNTNLFEKSYGYLSVYKAGEARTYDTTYMEYEKIKNLKTSEEKITNYTYENRRIKTINKLDSTTNYQYDDIGRLKGYSKNKLGNMYSSLYTYDDNGNIYIYNKNMEYEGQRLKSFNGKTINYDENGNVISYGTNILTFANNRLVSYNYGTDEITFNYDCHGRRIRKEDFDKLHEYYYENDRLIREKIVSKNIPYDNVDDIYYIHGVDGIIGFIYRNKPYFYHKNIFGDVEEIYDKDGVLYGSYEYDPFGNVTVTFDKQGISTINSIRYRGYYYDIETRLFWCNSRYYNPEWGRWISPDSIEYLDPESINGLNLYCYCKNNPIMYADPSGHIAISALLLGMAIGFGVGFAIGGGFEIGKQIYANGWNPGDWDWGQIGLSALGGGVAGAISSIPTGTGLVGYFLAFFTGGIGSALGGWISGSVTSLETAGMAFLIGGTANVLGKGVTDIINKIKVGKNISVVANKANKIASMSSKKKSLAIWEMIGMDNFSRNAYKSWGYDQILELLMTEANNQLFINSANGLTRYIVYSALISSFGSGWY